MDKSIRILITRKLSKTEMKIFPIPIFEIVSIPFIETAYHISDKQRVLELLKQPIHTIITSQNGVVSLLKNFGKEIVAQATWKIYCIGFATQEKIKTYFTKSTIVDTGKDINTLSDKMILSDNDKFYFLGSSIRQQYWIDKLKQNHKQVQEYWVYDTLLKSKKIDCNDYQAIVFFSPSAVDSFFLLNFIPQHIIFFAIGNTTAKAIQKYGKSDVIISSKPTLENLFIDIQKYFG